KMESPSHTHTHTHTAMRTNYTHFHEIYCYENTALRSDLSNTPMSPIKSTLPHDYLNTHTHTQTHTHTHNYTRLSLLANPSKVSRAKTPLTPLHTPPSQHTHTHTHIHT